MCGLFGWRIIQGDTRTFEPVIRAVATAMRSRGTESWGLAQVASQTSGRPSAQTIVTGVGAIPAQQMAVFWPVGLGHTRLATTGKIAAKNAHPWMVGTVIGAHNGVIWDAPRIDAYRVDSLALIERISLGLPVDDFEGYGAVSWISLTSGDPFVSRMTEGDMEVRSVKIGDQKATIWCSDWTRVNIPDGVRVRKYPKLAIGAVYRIRRDGRLRKQRYRLDLVSWGRYDARTWGKASGWCSVPDSKPTPKILPLTLCEVCGRLDCDGCDEEKEMRIVCR